VRLLGTQWLVREAYTLTRNLFKDKVMVLSSKHSTAFIILVIIIQLLVRPASLPRMF
jgi:hypothetical protein